MPPLCLNACTCHLPMLSPTHVSAGALGESLVLAEPWLQGSLENDPDGVPDYYDVDVEGAEADDDAEPTIATSARVYYSEDQYGEQIRTVIPYREQVSEDEDEQG